MKPGAIIRKAKLEELRTVQDLNRSLFESDFPSDPELNIEWPYEEEGEAYFKGAIAGTTGVCFVAELEGKIVGYLVGCIRREIPGYRPIKRSEIENMLVLGDYRSHGIGELLIREFLAWSKKLGAVKCLVLAYTPNVRAIAFYKRVGFKDYGVELETDL